MKWFLFLLLLIPANSFALGETESMKCSNGIVSPGNTIAELIEKCGQPAARKGTGKIYKWAGKNYYGEEWVYDFGPQEFVYYAIVAGNGVKLLYSTRDYGKKGL